MQHLRLAFSAIFLIACYSSLTSCQKEVNINLGTSADQVVVQGQIETGQPPFVVLTSTISFFSKVDLSTLENSFLHGAVVQVSNGIKTATLKEYSLDTGAANKFYVYSLDTNNIADFILGEVGRSYSLTITYSGKTYTSVTSIPNPKGVDTLWFGKPEFERSSTPDSAYQLYVNYSDPDTPGNYVRYYTQKNNGPFYPVDIFSDEVVNGKKINNIALYAGYETSVDVNGDSLRYFYPGDIVTLKWCEIDKKVYTFWDTYRYAGNSVGNPFASPINIQSNISNGALGIWAGYGSILTTLVVPH